MRNRIFWSLVLWALLLQSAKAQDYLSAVPKVGSQAPSLDLDIYTGGIGKPVKKNLETYRGKWLVLEFWGKYCVSCIEGFPHLETMHKQFLGEAAFLLIAGNHPKHDAGIKQFYEGFRKEYGLGFDTAFDTIAFKAFGIRSTPIAIVISPEGKIALVTTGKQLDGKTLSQLFTGQKSPAQTPAPKFETLHYTDSISSNAHTSSLSLADPSSKSNLELDLSAIKDGRFSTSPISLSRLYVLAYFGKALFLPADPLASTTWPKPIMEIADTSLFAPVAGKKSPYSYELQLKDNTRRTAEAQQAVQKDLQHWFPYSAKIEKRQMPVLRLIVTDSVKLKNARSIGGTASRKGDASGYELRNTTATSFLRLLRKYLSGQVLIDGTKTEFGLDIDLRANMTSPASIASALKVYGLDLISSKQDLDVLVISDKK